MRGGSKGRRTTLRRAETVENIAGEWHGNRDHEIGLLDDGRHAREVRRGERHAPLDAFARQEPLDDFFGSTLGPYTTAWSSCRNCFCDSREDLTGWSARIRHVKLSENSVCWKKLCRAQVREISQREIDRAGFESARHFLRRADSRTASRSPWPPGAVAEEWPAGKPLRRHPTRRARWVDG